MRILSTLLFTGLAATTPGVEAENVELQHGFHATVGESVPQRDNSSAYTYQVRGGMTLRMPEGKQAFSVDCAGLDFTDDAGNTVGDGYCVWRDTDDHRLFLSVQTAEGANDYTVTGGTGKWETAKGSFRTGFTYLPSPGNIYLGVETGSGSLER